MTVDIIIPTTFGNDYVNWLISSTQNYNMGAEYEITVVDNLAEPKFERSGIKSIRFEERLGFARAMNEGIKATNNEYVLLINNDTGIAHDNFLGNLIETINSEDKIGIVSPSTNFICTEQAKCPDLQSRDFKIIDFNGHIAAVCWVLKRSVIEEIGLFDENYKIGAFEDGDYCTRILNAGYKIKIDRRNWLFHYGSRTVSRTPGYGAAFTKNHEYANKKWGLK
jgi:hypothetical protein